MIAAILAAGESSRFGSCKQLHLINGKPMLQHVLTALPTNLKKFIIIGAYKDKIQKEFKSSLHFEYLINDKFQTGQWTSMWLAANQAIKLNEDLLVTLGDLPFVTTKDYQNLLGAFQQSPIFSLYGDEILGPPAIVPRTKLKTLIEMLPTKKAKDIFENKQTISMANASRDIDYKKDLMSF